MKPATTLRELLKPPFYHAGLGQIHEGNTRIMESPGYVCEDDNVHDSHVAKIRGWGFLQYFENGEELQDEFIEFVVQALNEKWGRDYGNPRTCNFCYCRKDYQLFCRGQEMDIEYCPFCGRRLPPEEVQNG